MLHTSTGENIISFIKEHYGIDVIDVKPLEGYANLNFRIKDDKGNSYVFKSHQHADDKLLCEPETAVLNQLTKQFQNKFPKPIQALNEAYIIKQESKDNNTTNRILSWLEGDLLVNVPHSINLFVSFGNFLAKLDKELLEMNDPVIAARHMEWDVQHFLDLHSKSKCITDPSLRKLVDYYFVQYKEFVFPKLHQLRKSIIHNDANDWNVLVQNGKVSGLIDFGDMVYAPLIQELAVAISYAMFEKDDPIKWAAYIISGYHEILPLEEKELELMYYLIAARLCMSVILSSEGIQNNPKNEYLLISQKPAWDLLNKWIAISPDMAEKKFKEAAGISVPEKSDIQKDLEKRHQFVSKVLSVSYDKPVKMKRAAFQYMFDANGNTFLDAYNNIPHVGHQHPRVVEAGQKQMAVLNTNTRYIYDQLAAYAEKLIAKFPAPFSKVFFVNSGSAASDLAIRMAQIHTQKQKLVVMEHGYHGHTRLGVDISHYKFGGRGGSGQKEYIIKAPIPDTYRGEFRDDEAGIKYANQLSKLLNQNNDPVTAFISEPIVGCGGQVPLAPGYLKEVYPMIRKKGGVCISDEVQIGFGRLGTYFWGFEAQGVIPDIVVLGKPMGNGHPIGAVVTTDEIAESFDNGMEFFSSFGGNPVTCEIGMAVLDVIEEENLQQNAFETGEYFMNLLLDLQQEFPVIGDVRGSGLFIGVEFVKDPDTLEPNTELAQYLKNKLRENFILVSTDGPFDSVIKMKPPMCFGRENVDLIIEQIQIILQNTLLLPNLNSE
jgi:4-aminobutyrate aminotransferase-like enzyme/thiamine kinase-like enzyme